MLREKLKIYYPKSLLLSQHIDYFYFLETTEDFHSHYFSYPNTITSFNIHRQIQTEIGDHYIKVSHNPSNDHAIVLQGKFLRPLEVVLSGRIDKVTIGFKPLGICHFIDENFGNIASQTSQIFTGWNDKPQYQIFQREFYGTEDLNQRVHLLEQYLLERYRPVIGLEVLHTALGYLVEDNNYSIPRIAEFLDLNEKTFNRLFYKHLGITPNAFRMISRFRRSMTTKLLSENSMSLTEACYRGGFYDQAYFNKIYRKTTGDTPSRFFDEIDMLGEDQLFFKIAD